MKRIFLFSLIILLAAGAQAQTTTAKPKPVAPKPATTVPVNPLKNLTDSLSYAFGISMGEYLKSLGVKTVNTVMLNKAIDQSIKGQPTFFDANVANQCISKVAEMNAQKTAGAEKAKGEKFLAENKNKPGIMVTPSGLQYEVLVQGTGPKPKITDKVVTHYRGTLVDGKEFDNSYKRGEPLSISVSGVIAGWTEALQLMTVGSKYKLYIPSSLGYGEYGAGADIPGGATLIFIIELLSIEGQ